MNNKKPFVLLSIIIAVGLMGVSVFIFNNSIDKYEKAGSETDSTEIMVYENVKIAGKQSSGKQDIEYEYKVKLKNGKDYWLKNIEDNYKIDDEIEVTYPESKPEEVQLSENKKNDDSEHFFYFIPLILAIPIILRLKRKRQEERAERS